MKVRPGWWQSITRIGGAAAAPCLQPSPSPPPLRRRCRCPRHCSVDRLFPHPPSLHQFGKYLVEKQRQEWAAQYVGAPSWPSCACCCCIPHSPCTLRRRRSRLPRLDSDPSPLQTADYKALKDLIKESATEEATAGVQSFSPRTTSLTVQRAADKRDSGALPARRSCGLPGLEAAARARRGPAGSALVSAPPHPLPTPPPSSLRTAAEERFFQKLEAEVEKCGQFTARLVAELRERLKQLQGKVQTAGGDAARRAQLLEASFVRRLVGCGAA